MQSDKSLQDGLNQSRWPHWRISHGIATHASQAP